MNDQHQPPLGVAVDRDVGRAVQANRSIIAVPVGGNAVHCIVNPLADPHLEWALRYCINRPDGKGEPIALVAAGVLAGFDYLCSDAITMKEATRRLRLMRSARRAALTPNAN
jgi:hypothetical protein